MKNKKINVLQFITPVGFYGAERWILALVNNSDPDKVRHDLVVTQESDSQDLEITEQFPEGEGRAFRIPMKSRFDLAVIARLSEIIAERSIDIIHTHGYKSDILGLIAARKNSIRCVSTPHGFGNPEGFKLRSFIRLGIFSYRFMDLVVPLSRQLADEIRSKGVPAEKIRLIMNAVDLSEIDRELALDCDKRDQVRRVMGYIGRFDDNKNVGAIIEAFDAVWQGNQDIELILVGDGETRSELEQLAASLDSSQSIRFLGFRQDRLEWMRQFDMFVLASRHEGIPRCLMEAMAMGVPVVAYDVSGVDQLVTQEETGLLSAFGDKEGMVSNCRRVLEDPHLASRLAEAGKQFVRENYSGDRMAREYLDCYQSLLETPQH